MDCYTASTLVNEHLVLVPVKEALPGFPVLLGRRASIPLTPAAEHLADLRRHAAAQQ